MPRFLTIFAVLVIAILSVGKVEAQDTTGPRLNRPLRVFFDCRGGCDFDYFRTEAPYLDYVRDQADADFHVMVLRQGIGGGGTEYEIRYIGSGPFADIDQTQYYVSGRDDTFDETRQGMLQVFLMGLMPYIARTPAGPLIRISATQGSFGQDDEPVTDHWNLWVFGVRASGSFESEEQLDRLSLDGSFSANRTTADWKINVNVDGRMNRRNYTLSDGRSVLSETSRWNAESLIVRSMSGHWSTGAFATAGGSTQNNQDLRVRSAIASEYNLYPYDQSTQRQFTVLYSVGVTGFDYIEETVFEQTTELLTDQAVNVGYELRRPWGFANVSAEASHYLHDFSRNRLDLSGRMNFRIFRGLSFNLSANAVRIRDQLYLPRGEASDEEILTQQRQLATGYRYDSSIGVNYTFGSIFNTVVNPRFTGSSRRF